MEGLVYKVQSYKESSKLLFVYTPKGKVTLVAKGAQKLNTKVRVIAQYLTKLSFKEVENKNFYTLMEPQLLDEYLVIKNQYQKTKQAALILEIIDRLIIDQINHQIIYDEAIKALKEKDLKIASLSFALKVLNPLGYQIDFTTNGKTILGISIEKGGLVFEGEPYRIDLSTKNAILLLKLYTMDYNEQKQYDLEQVETVNQFIKLYYEYHLNIKLKNFD